jgi:hypothetical protein
MERGEESFDASDAMDRNPRRGDIEGALGHYGSLRHRYQNIARHTSGDEIVPSSKSHKGSEDSRKIVFWLAPLGDRSEKGREADDFYWKILKPALE